MISVLVVLMLFIVCLAVRIGKFECRVRRIEEKLSIGEKKEDEIN
ncbi:MAG: hypothetical protein H6Q70_86 [Firmicutes bacterium]|nr:hypothetical protein [Bacillota bacterium]